MTCDHVRKCWSVLAAGLPEIAKALDAPSDRLRHVGNSGQVELVRGKSTPSSTALAQCQTAVADLGRLTEYMSAEEVGPVHGARLGDPAHITGRLLTVAAQLECMVAGPIAALLREACAALQSSAEQVETQAATIGALKRWHGELACYITEHHQPGQVEPDSTAVCDGYERGGEATPQAVLRLLKLAAARGAFSGAHVDAASAERLRIVAALRSWATGMDTPTWRDGWQDRINAANAFAEQIEAGSL
jgi:hypothetical protein